MPKLKFVNLSFNQLSMPLKQTDVDVNIRWDYLRNLVLNSTQIDWKSVQQILDYSPTLEELHLSLNEYDHVKLCDSSTKCDQCEEISNKNDNLKKPEAECSCGKVPNYKRHKHLGVKKFHFNGNPVSKWSEIRKLGYAFPNLESLVVADCPIMSLDAQLEEGTHNREYNRCESECESSGNSESPHDSFRHLKFLNLNSTQLSTWDEIERLSKFPVLQCLRIQVSSAVYFVYAIFNCKFAFRGARYGKVTNTRNTKEDNFL